MRFAIHICSIPTFATSGARRFLGLGVDLRECSYIITTSGFGAGIMNRIGYWLEKLLSILMAALFCLPAIAVAQTADMYKDRIRTWSTIAPLPEAVFGERYDLYKGELSFYQEDLRLSGAGPDIVVGRTFAVNGWQSVVGPRGFADWEITIPRLVTKSPSSPLWQSGSSSDRCTNFAGLPAHKPPYFDSREWWNGIQLVDQTGNRQDVMRRHSVNSQAPDGQISVYKGVTKDHWQFSCLSTTANGQPGEAILGLAPDGTRYWFDWLVLSDQHDGLEKDGVDGKPHVLLLYRAMLLVTRIEDRFGNFLTYAYDGKNLQSIRASDGRLVTFGWASDGGSITSMTSSGKTWGYQYTTYPTVTPLSGLTRVVYPDGASMQFDLGLLFYSMPTEPATVDCNPAPAAASLLGGDPDPGQYVGTITAPSGLVGTFTIQQQLRGRTKVPAGCTLGAASYSALFVANALVKRQYIGPGGVNRIWQYQYSPAAGSWASCGTCSVTTASTTVIDPDGGVSRSTYSTEWGAYEGKLLLQEDGITAAGALRTTTYQYAPTDGMLYPSLIGWMPPSFSIDNDKPAQTYSPLWRKTVVQQGRTFVWEVSATCGGTGDQLCFDEYARPTKMMKGSTP